MRRLTLIAAAATALLAGAAEAQTQTFEQTGSASWYGDRHHGRKTASGETFDMHKITAAHPKLPMGSMLEVTNLANDKTIQVRVNDRGPFKSNRILDLSRAGAEQLGFIGVGTTQVRIRLVAADVGELRPKQPVQPVLEPVSLNERLDAPAFSDGGYVVQVGMFSVRANAERAAKKVAGVGPTKVIEDWRSGRVLHRVSVEGWSDRSSAEAAQAAVVAAGFADAQVAQIES